MKNTISNRTPEGTHDREVMGGLTVTGEAFRRFYFGEEVNMDATRFRTLSAPSYDSKNEKGAASLANPL